MQQVSFSRTDWMKIGGAAVVLGSSFLAWLDISLEQGDTVRHGTANAFDFTFTGAIPVVLAVLVGSVTVLLSLGRIPRERSPWPIAMAIAAFVAAALLVIRLVVNPYDGRTELEHFGGSVDRGIGMVLAPAGAVVVAIGAALAFRESRRSRTNEPIESAGVEWAPDPHASPAFPPPSAPQSPAS